MRVAFYLSILAVLLASPAVGQEPVPILKATWQRAFIKAPKQSVDAIVPAKPMIAENKYFQRKAREQRTDNPMDPYEASIEGRSAAMERAVQESRTPQPDDKAGFEYVALFRNDTGRAIQVIFWEYQFTEIARPTNVVRRQFLCAAKLKDGEKRELSVFSTLGPSDSIAVDSLAKTTEKLFNEQVRVNRIEFSDGAILQRDGWKYSDVKKDVERVTSTPWQTEICRAL